jgi:hypothetical protein
MRMNRDRTSKRCGRSRFYTSQGDVDSGNLVRERSMLGSCLPSPSYLENLEMRRRKDDWNASVRNGNVVG